MITLYQPFRIINNVPHPINARGFLSEKEAMDYATITRGYKESEITLNESKMEDDVYNDWNK